MIRRRRRPGGAAYGGRGRGQAHPATGHPGYRRGGGPDLRGRKLIYRLRDVILLIVVAGFVALILNPLVLAVQRWGIRRRGLAVTVVTLWALLVFTGLAIAFGYPLVNGITTLPATTCRRTSARRSTAGADRAPGAQVPRPDVGKEQRAQDSELRERPGKPALTLGKGAITLVISLLTIFVLVVSCCSRGRSCGRACWGSCHRPGAERYSRPARAAQPARYRVHARKLADVDHRRAGRATSTC